MSNTILAVSGDPGSFSEEAGLIYAQRENITPEILFATDMQGVLAAINEDRADVGVFPVVNSRGGLVRPAFQAMGRYNFEYFDEIWMEIYQCLLVLPGTKASDITCIASHSQALAQCDRHLQQNFKGIELKEWIDTARAAKDLSDGTLPATTAVIAPARAAHRYGLEILEKGIQDNHPNLTTFIVVRKRRD